MPIAVVYKAANIIDRQRNTYIQFSDHFESLQIFSLGTDAEAPANCRGNAVSLTLGLSPLSLIRYEDNTDHALVDAFLLYFE